MCAFAHVTTILPFREVCANSLTAKLVKAKDDWQVQNALHDHIEELTAFAERESRMTFRLVNLLTSQQLYAYDEIAEQLGKDATNEQWTAAIKEWKKKQPRHE